MKRIKQISVLAIIAGAILVLTCCSKQETDEPMQNQMKDAGMSPEDISVMNKLVVFRDKVKFAKENPGYKSGETMSVDSAKWYLDASFNFTYAFTKEIFTLFNTDTFSITVSKNAEMINLEDVINAFYEIKTKTLIIYDSTEWEQKELYASYMEITGNTSDEVVIKTTATIGSKNNTPPPGFGEWGPYVEGNDWMYGEKLGDCSPSGGIWWGVKDAATEIAGATNTYRHKYIQDEGPGWTAYYTEPSAIATVTVYLSSQAVKEILRTPGDAVIDNYRDYLVLYQEKDIQNGLIVETCIPWQDMNFYYHGTRKVIYNIVQENYNVFGVDDGLTFYFCSDIEGIGEGGGNFYNPNYAYHIVEALYKTRHISYYEPISINE